MEKFKLTIKVRKHEPLIINEADLIQQCWGLLIDINERQTSTALDVMQDNYLDELMQNYFTIKMIYTEYNLDLTNEMIQIEEFILNELKKSFKIAELEALNNFRKPAFQIID